MLCRGVRDMSNSAEWLFCCCGFGFGGAAFGYESGSFDGEGRGCGPFLRSGGSGYNISDIFLRDGGQAMDFDRNMGSGAYGYDGAAL